MKNQTRRNSGDEDALIVLVVSIEASLYIFQSSYLQLFIYKLYLNKTLN